MKKLIIALMLLAILLPLCACGQETASDTQMPTETTAPAETTGTQTGAITLTPEMLYGHINQLEPVDGVYQIWNAEGVKNIANHPDGSFKLLCNVDMEGQTLAPIGNENTPFTGELNGANFTISNFTLQGGAETAFGFVSVNQGNIHNLLLDKVTFLPGSQAQYIGTMAGINRQPIQRCTVRGSLNVAQAAENAVCGSLTGISTGDLLNTVLQVDLSYSAAGSATVAGISGVAENCKIEFIETKGKLEISGSNKTAGLFVGEAKNLNTNTLVFTGAANTLDGRLFENYFGTDENNRWINMLVRENDREPEDPVIREKRQKVADYMNACTTIRWKVRHDMVKSSTSCQCSSCHGSFSALYEYYGAPYNHKASSLYRMQYALDEEGYLKEFVEYAGAGDGFDMYIGSDCSTSTCMAYQTVGTEVCYTQTQDQVPAFGKGTYTVGPYELDPSLNLNNAHKTRQHCAYNGEEVMYESYAQMRMADSVVFWDDGAGHSRLAVADAVVVRDENGKISGQYSYVTMTEQGRSNLDDVNMTYTSWTANWDYSFANLYGNYYIPTTIKEFITGQFEPIACRLSGGVDNSRLGLTTGVITSNYAIDSVTMIITDENGEEVYNHRIFTTSSKMVLDGTNHSRNRAPCKEYNMASFATALQQQVAFRQGGTYHATITANLMTGDEILVQEVTFTNGQA